MYKNMKLNDEFYTSKSGVLPILEFLKPNSIIWCPFDTRESEYVKVLENAGHRVINTHIWNGEDFLKVETPKNIDYIISNPPYSIKEDVFKKLFKLKIPFAMLMGVQSLTIRKFMKLWKEQHLQLIIFENKIFFKQPDIGQNKCYKESGTYFHTYYFCNGWLPKDLYLRTLEKYKLKEKDKNE